MVSVTIIYIAIALIVLAVIFGLLVYSGKVKARKEISKIAMLAMALVVLGIIFSDDPLIGYGLIAAGVLLAVADVIINRKK